MRKKPKFWILLIIAIALGVLICWIDTRPNWDDTGITAAMVFAVTTCLGFMMPDRAWIWVFAVWVWIPLWGIVLSNNYAAVLALAVAFIGAYVGAFIRKLFLSRA